MRAIEAIRKPMVSVPPDATLMHAAELMESANVGALVVLDGERLAGIVTDRDIVVRGVAHQLPADARIDAVMTTEVVTLDADADLRAALPILRTHACRRLPLVSNDRVVGMLTVDDLLIDLIADLGDIARPITGEVIFGHHESQLPARTAK
ncbi:MAG: CBS domain-containing protein [Acidimicrobiia bacterium]